MQNLSAKLVRPDSANASATAWLVSDEYALTARHCILDEMQRPYPDDARFRLEFDSGDSVEAIVTESSDDVDAAVLHLLNRSFDTGGKITFGFLPTNDAWQSWDEDRKKWTSWGYPQGRREGLLVDGHIVLPEAAYSGKKAIQLNCKLGGHPGSPLSGLSGAAVMHEQALVGIIVSGPEDFEQQVIYAIPIQRIANKLNTVRSILAAQYQRELDRLDRSADMSSGVSWRAAGSMNVAAEGIARRANLVCKSTRLYGRDTEVLDITARIDAGARLVTLHGDNGCGKTRLAYAVGARFLRRYDGVFMADLFACEDADSVLTEIANTLSVKEAHDNLLEESLNVVIGARKVLLILDGAERLDDSRALVERLLANCVNLRVLVIRRQPLAWDGQEESTHLVKPLELGFDNLHGEALMARSRRSFVLSLFQDHIRRTTPAFNLSVMNIDLVATLCKSTAGIPLAIEIVAGHAGPVIAASTDIGDAYAALEKCRMALKAIESDIPSLSLEARLDAIITLAAESLDPQTYSLFLRLSAFAGGCTLEAVEYISADLGFPLGEIAGKLELLVKRGLLSSGTGIKGRPYYRLQPAILAYCRRMLETREQEQQVSRQVAAYFAQLAHKAERRLTLLSSEELIEWFELLEFEYSNVRNALAWAHRNPDGADAGLGIVGDLFWFWNLRGSLVEGIRWSVRLLEKSAEPTRNRGAALYCSGGLHFLRGDFKQARDYLAQSIAIWETLKDTRRLGFSLVILGTVALHQKKLEEALQTEQSAVNLFTRLDDRTGYALALNDFANVMAESDKAEAQRCYQASLAVWTELRNNWGIGLSMSNLGRLASSNGNYKEGNEWLAKAMQIQEYNRYQWGYAESIKAMAYALLGEEKFQKAAEKFRESLIAHQRLGRKQLVADCLDGLGKVAVKLHFFLHAAYLFGAASGIRTRSEQELPPAPDAELQGYLALARVCSIRDEFDEEFSAGENASFAEISQKTLACVEEMIAVST